MWTKVDNIFPITMIFDACMSQKLKKSLWVAEIRGYIQFLSQMQTFCTITTLLTQKYSLYSHFFGIFKPG